MKKLDGLVLLVYWLILAINASSVLDVFGRWPWQK